jgi:hypothetical protein
MTPEPHFRLRLFVEAQLVSFHIGRKVDIGIL